MRDLIFLSHAHEDKDLVGTIAEELRLIYGEDKIFYDSWSMKPGENLIEGMNKGLENCAYFFLFMSGISIEKPMVRLEWHNALLHSLKDKSSFIPVRIDNINPPAILTTTLYLDMYNRGLPQTVEDMKLLITGRGLYNPTQLKPFTNLEVELQKVSDKKLKITVVAKKLVEPVNHFAFYISDGKEAMAVGMSTISTGTVTKNGISKNIQTIEQHRTITPGNPQEFFINDPSTNFNLEVYHVQTANNANLIFSGSIDMNAF